LLSTLLAQKSDFARILQVPLFPEMLEMPIYLFLMRNITVIQVEYANLHILLVGMFLDHQKSPFLVAC
jgi:hypothetical protein